MKIIWKEKDKIFLKKGILWKTYSVLKMQWTHMLHKYMK
jgi:hypothetical protein